MNSIGLAEKIRILEDKINRGKRAQKNVRRYILAFQNLSGHRKNPRCFRHREILDHPGFCDCIAKLWKISV